MEEVKKKRGRKPKERSVTQTNQVMETSIATRVEQIHYDPIKSLFDFIGSILSSVFKF